MKIAECKLWSVAVPPPHFGGLYWIFVKLTTNTGISGYGEIYSVPFSSKVVMRMAEDMWARLLEGEDPFRIEAFWRRAYGSGYVLRPDISAMGIASGLEMACWDIIGKALDKPVYELLGGLVHPRLRAYSYLYPEPGDKSLVYEDPDLLASRAADSVQKGFTAVKFDPVGAYSVFDPRQLSLENLSQAERMVRCVREAVGDKCDLLIGTHGQMTPSGALRLARRIEPFDPLWLEEPVPPDNMRAMREVARKTRIPIATGERLTTKYEFAALLHAGAASILQMATGRSGGLLEAKKIAALAECHHAQIAPHLYCGPIEGAANIQLSACCPNFLIQESIQDWGGFSAKILKKPVHFEEGWIIPSCEPGLGVELDEECAEQNPWTGTELHLDMQQNPIQEFQHGEHSKQ